jgi:hypothetical protein
MWCECTNIPEQGRAHLAACMADRRAQSSVLLPVCEWRFTHATSAHSRHRPSQDNSRNVEVPCDGLLDLPRWLQTHSIHGTADRCPTPCVYLCDSSGTLTQPSAPGSTAANAQEVRNHGAPSSRPVHLLRSAGREPPGVRATLFSLSTLSFLRGCVCAQRSSLRFVPTALLAIVVSQTA